MNAHAFGARVDTFGWRARQGAALLEHAASPPMQLLAVVLAMLLGGLALLAAGTIDKPEWVSVTLFLAGLGVAALWGIWFSRVLLLHVEARQARMPGVVSAVGGALSLAFLATVALPALLLALGGVRPGLAVCAMALAACSGVLLAALPRIVYLLLCFVPLLFGVARPLLEWVLPAGVALPWQPALDDVVWLLPPVLALGAWRWRAIVRGAGEPSPSSWWQPAIVAHSRPGAVGGWFAGGRRHADLPDWFWPAGQTAGAGPDDPVRAMRALIGTPFAPLGGGQILVQVGLGALAIAYLVIETIRDGDGGSLASGAMGGAGVLVLMYGQRLDAMYRKRAAELDELALLPGFGDADRQRGALLRAVSWSPGWAMLAVLVLLAGTGVLLGLAPRMVALMLMTGIGLALLTAITCLRPLAGRRMDGSRMLLLAGPGLLLALVTVAYASQAQGAGIVPLVLAVLWLAVYAAGGRAVAAHLRRIRACPHPFLQDRSGDSND